MQLGCVLLLLLFPQLALAQSVVVDLGWVTAVQQDRGWLITNAPAPPPMYKGQRNLQTGDLLLSIDGHQLSSLGPLGVARMLNDVPFRAVPIVLERKGKTYEVRAFREGVLTDGTVKSAPSYSPSELQGKDQGAPQFSLTDFAGQRHTAAMYKGRWVLLNFWGTWCSGCREELPVLNYLSERHSAEVTVLGVDINDEIGTLRRFLSQHPLSYPVLLGGAFDDSFARSYNVHSAPTNVVISPDGKITFVGSGPMSLKGAAETIARAQSDTAPQP